MKFYDFEAKTLEEVKTKALQELKVSEEDLIIVESNEKGGLFKKAEIKVTTINDIITYLKEILTEITKLMNLEVNLEVRRRDNNISIKIFSNNNSILIGKNGKTVSALQLLLKQILNNQVNTKIMILLDVENYKEKRQKNITWLAKKTAREVAKTKVEVKLDRMNSYERRLVHEALADDKYVYTESIGEEPERYLVIKPRSEKE